MIFRERVSRLGGANSKEFNRGFRQNNGDSVSVCPSFCILVSFIFNFSIRQNYGQTNTESPLFCLNPLLNPFLLAPLIISFMSFFNKPIEILYHYQFLYHFIISSLREWRQKMMGKTIQDHAEICRN